MTTSFSIEAWIKVNSFVGNDDTIISKGNNTWRLQRRAGTNSLRFGTNTTGTHDLEGNANVNDGAWHHVVAVYLNGFKFLWVDGVLDNGVFIGAAPVLTNTADIRIGDNSNLQDGTVVHIAARGLMTVVGRNVTVGHKALLHACEVQDGAFIGMNSTVLDGAVVESEAMVAAGALVAPGKIVRRGELWAGNPARKLRDLTEKDFADFKRPEPFIPKSIGHHAEWIRACKTGEPTTCNFQYAGWLTEANHLGNVAYRAGQKLEWDSAKLRATNTRAAEKFIRREYRKGWKLA
jgi:carbonic anhydrase/acetyltransferase-like protein (isoleucine patch superfamily)